MNSPVSSQCTAGATDDGEEECFGEDESEHWSDDKECGRIGEERGESFEQPQKLMWADHHDVNHESTHAAKSSIQTKPMKCTNTRAGRL
jgi:hypothetical protein